MRRLVIMIALGALLTVGAGCAGTTTTNSSSKAATPSTNRINLDGGISVGALSYYRVKAGDPSADTGNKACAKVGKKCVGYTDTTLSTCLAFHPDAASVTDLDGAKPGFYCDGSPEGGVCAREKNTCHRCPECNMNMDCGTVAGTLYREMFVECK